MTAAIPRVSFLPFHRPQIAESDIDAVVEVLRSGWLTTGPRARAFENEFAKCVGATHAVSLSSGTAALHLALEAIGVTAGDEVIVPTMTYAASAEVVGYLGATTVLVDCRSDTLTIDPDATARAISPHTKAIIAVHLGGHPCDMDALLTLARSKSVQLVEDAAHALSASYRGRPIGSIGDFTCFSFYATKPITTGEGGMVTTENAEHAKRIRTMRLHGLEPVAEGGSAWDYLIRGRGFKYNLSDIAAALGLSQLRRCETMRRRREEIANAYNNAFTSVSALLVPWRDPCARPSWHLYTIRLLQNRLTVDRDQFAGFLAEMNIGTSVHFKPLHQHPHYAHCCEETQSQFPNADAAFASMLSLPIYPNMSNEDVGDVIDAVLTTVEHSKR